MHYIPQVLFILLLLVSGFYIVKNVRRIIRNINLGKPEDRSDRPSERFRKMLLIAFGQKKMFKKPIPAILHLFIYVGFIIINIEVLEILIDGIFGKHRVFVPFLGTAYSYMISFFEFLALSVLIACIVFLVRRNIVKVNRFEGEEMKKWPKTDANNILIIEVVLMIAFLTMNASDAALQSRGFGHYIQTGSFFFSTHLASLFTGMPDTTLYYIERFCWWFHIIGIFGFANYIFYDSKHLHIFMAFPNTYYSKLEPVGKWDNMASVTREVKLMLNLPVEEQANPEADPGKFGAKDVQDLTWKNLLDAYSCTECGRCTQQCPANITGKKLSPRKIMMDTRDRAEEVGKNIELHGKDFSDTKALLEDYITSEELLACTTCNACVEACPVNINPLDIIVKLRRYKIMESSQAPASWNAMFSNIENNAAPWKFSPSDRFNWADKLSSDSKNNS